MEFVLTNAQSNTCHARKRLSRLDERNKYTGKVEKLNMNTNKNKIESRVIVNVYVLCIK